MPLTDDDIRAIVARADAIERSRGVGRDDAEALVRAGEELGITRQAMERALREHLGVPAEPPALGELTFARSMDGKYYVAEVRSTSAESMVVRFLRGGERTVTLEELRACLFLPGERIVCPWPGWGAWTCTVLTYNAEARQVTVTDGWGETATFGAGDVWLAPRTAEARRRRRLVVALVAAAASVGAVLGAAITALITG